MKNLISHIFKICLIMSLWANSAQAAKVLILYSSIGMGHLSASKVIEGEIKQQDPNAEIVMKDIRDFMPPVKRRIDEKLYFFIFKHLPSVFTSLYRGSIEKGNSVVDLGELNSDYSQVRLKQYIADTKPDTVIATHYGSAIVLGTLKQQGIIKNIKTAWVHTDYLKHYFPRISLRLDKSFVGHDGLAEYWKSYGVSPEQVTVSGIPSKIFPRVNKESKQQVIDSYKFESDQKFFAISGGSEGLRDYVSVVQSIAKEFENEKIQINAVCGRNLSEQKKLEALKKNLPPNVNLKVFGFIPYQELMDYILISDAYITKAGGLSPGEGASMVKPLVLVSEYGGHEAENADFFESQKLAFIVKKAALTGPRIRELLGSPENLDIMERAQVEFRNQMNVKSIADFALAKNQPKQEVFNLGVLGGEEVIGQETALEKINEKFPANLEVLLSSAKAKSGTYFGDGRDSNPFGHIAIRVGSDVYTVNHMAKKGEDRELLVKMSLGDYLYSSKSFSVNEEFTGLQGQAYAKDTFGVRYSGIREEELKSMLVEIDKINAEWSNGQIIYDSKKSNCADLTTRILTAGNILAEHEIPQVKVRLPLDIFDAFVKKIESKTDFPSSVIHYSYVNGSKNEYKNAGFPLSFYQVNRARRSVMKKGIDAFMSRIDGRVYADVNAVLRPEVLRPKPIVRFCNDVFAH